MVYKTGVDGIHEGMLTGFFVGWPDVPDPQTHLRLLQNSDKRVLAIDESNGRVVGFITAITDGVLSSYIPFLEVVPEYQERGIGESLVERMLEELKGIYMIDVMCDEELQPFYERLGMQRSQGMIIRNYHRQSGK
ncbi:GNAT family N-acetyltransferase [Alteribacter aurantiacus]|uniref:GNAT family N-acetyltransferase n=1 Tax=Alteribacter aurantiacus TaxID=254410 RepID=UPI0004787FF9|nr:GNAT family N-acetyltransferase [Alteribacter aurantiacus]